ncbi:MAG TPA: amidohydrolase family protein [Candidatus Bathyarchaeia archaeon]
MDEYSLLIKNATIVDGSGKSPFKGSIGMKGDKVTALGEVKGDSAREIDGKGLTAVPGFIDSHSHGDIDVLFFPKCESYLLQGVTTMVAGQCGMSLAPIKEKTTLLSVAEDYLDEIEPYKYYPKRTVFPREEINALMKEKFGWTIDWHSMEDWFRVVEKKRISMNMATLVGHVTVRRTVMEDDFQRPSTRDERDEMGALIRQSLKDGCYGMSVGLDYDPDTYADHEELVEHCKIVAEYGRIFAPHSRRTGRRRDVAAGHRQHDKIDGILEAIKLCRDSGVKMNIAHLFTGWYVTPQGYPHILEEANRRATLMVIDEARKEGLDISFDLIPSTLTDEFGSAQYLCGSFAPWVREKGSRAEFANWLRLEEYRQEIKDAMKQGKWYIRENYNPNTNPRWAENYTILKHSKPETVDKSIAKVAEERGKDPFDVWFDLIVEDPDALCGQTFVYPSGTPDLNAPYHSIFFEHPQSCIGIDTGVDDCKYESKKPTAYRPMLLSYSAFPSFYERFVKRDKKFTLEEAVHKTSTQAAVRYNIQGRGTLTKGSYADIVLMDLSKLKVMGTALEPRKKPKGIEYVVVNGEVVVEKGEHTGATPGKVLRRK